MLLEQIHFPISGPNWNKILLGTVVIISVGAIFHYATKHSEALKFKAKQRLQEEEDGTENANNI